MIEKLFRVSERGSTAGREVRGGLVTFVTMSYIIVLNPLILGTGTDVAGATLGVAQVASVTALAAGVMTLLFGVVANLPFAIATGLGINVLVAATLAPMMTWPEAMGLVVVDGLVIVLLAASGFRTAVFTAVPTVLECTLRS